MIDFHEVWLPQIVGYAEVIATGQLEDEWLGRVERATSISHPDELYEQVFDDLDADGIWAENLGVLPKAKAEAVDAFLSALRVIDEPDASALVGTDAWVRVKQAAARLQAEVG